MSECPAWAEKAGEGGDSSRREEGKEFGKRGGGREGALSGKGGRFIERKGGMGGEWGGGGRGGDVERKRERERKVVESKEVRWGGGVDRLSSVVFDLVTEMAALCSGLLQVPSCPVHRILQSLQLTEEEV